MVSWFDPTYLAKDFPLNKRLKLLEYDVLNTYQENDSIVHSLTEILLDRIFLLLAVFTETKDFKSPSQLIENLTKQNYRATQNRNTRTEPDTKETAYSGLINSYASRETTKLCQHTPTNASKNASKNVSKNASENAFKTASKNASKNAVCQTNIISSGLKIKQLQDVTEKMAKLLNLPILSSQLTETSTKSIHGENYSEQTILDALTRDLLKIERITANIMSKFSPMRRKNENLESEIKILTSKLKNIENSSKNKENELSEKLEHNLSRKDQTYGLERKHQQLEYERKLKNLTDQIVLGKQALDSKELLILELKTQLDSLKSTDSSRNFQVDKLQAKIEERIREACEIQSKLQKTELVLQQVQGKMAEIEIEFRENKQKLAESVKKNDVLEKRNDKLIERQERLVEEVDRMNDEMETVGELNLRYEVELEGYKSDLGKLEADLKARESKIDDLNVKVREFEKIVKQKEKEVSGVKHDLGELGGRLEREMVVNEDLQGSCEEWKSRYSVLKQTNNYLSNQNETLARPNRASSIPSREQKERIREQLEIKPRGDGSRTAASGISSKPSSRQSSRSQTGPLLHWTRSNY